MNWQVNLPTTVLRQVDGYLQEYLTQKSRRKEIFSDLWCARPRDSGSIGTEEGLFEPPQSLSSSRAVVERILCQRSSEMRDQQRVWQVILTEYKIVALFSFPDRLYIHIYFISLCFLHNSDFKHFFGSF